jgi:hypothetical protein
MLFAPGLGVSLAIYRPGELPLVSRIALAAALGYGTFALTSYALVLGGVLYPIPVFAIVFGLTVGAWVIAWRRGSFRDPLRHVRQEIRADLLGMLLGAGCILAIAALAFGSVSRFRARIPFRYWVDGMQMARLHEIPGSSIEYGTLFPTVNSKVLLDAFNAPLNFIVSAPQTAVGPLLWIAIVGSAIALWACARELGLGAIAAAIPVLAFANPILLGGELSRDLNSYKAEGFGRFIAFTALIFAVRAIRDRDVKDAVVGAAVLALSAATHLIPTVFVCMFIAGYGLSAILVGRSRSRVVALARQAAILVGGVAFGYALIQAAPTRSGLEGATGPGAYAGYPAGFDPTAFLFGGATTVHPADDHWFRTPRQIFVNFMNEALGHQRLSALQMPAFIAIAIVTLAIALYVLFRIKTAERYVPLTCWTATALSIAAALFFSRRYDIYALATFGSRRLFDYSALPIFLGGAALLQVAFGPLSRFRNRAPAAASAVVAAVLAGACLTAYAGQPRQADREALSLLSWVRVNTPCDVRLAVNTRTVGVFQATTGRVSVTEGMGPFLRPVMLKRVVPLLMDARSFFHDPSSGRDFLRRQGVDYVVVVKNLPIGFDGVMGKTNEEAFRSDPDLELVEDRPRFTIYRVRQPPTAPASLPQRFPCETTPIG